MNEQIKLTWNINVESMPYRLNGVNGSIHTFRINIKHSAWSDCDYKLGLVSRPRLNQISCYLTTTSLKDRPCVWFKGYTGILARVFPSINTHKTLKRCSCLVPVWGSYFCDSLVVRISQSVYFRFKILNIIWHIIRLALVTDTLLYGMLHLTVAAGQEKANFN